MDFWERLDRAIEATPDIRTRKGLAQALGFNVGNISAWKTRGDYPRGDLPAAIARKLNTTVEYLVTGEQAEIDEPWYKAHRELIDDLRALPADKLRGLAIQAKALADDERSGLGKSGAAG